MQSVTKPPKGGFFILQSIANLLIFNTQFDKPTYFIYNSRTFQTLNRSRKVPLSLIELIKSKFTLIAVDTVDYYIADQVLASLLEDDGFVVQSFKASEAKTTQANVLWSNNVEPSIETVSKLSINQKTLLILNYKGENPAVFRAGKLGTPFKMIENTLLKKYTHEERQVFLSVVDGLSYTEAKQLVRLSSTRSAPITARTLKSLRSELYGASDGINIVNPEGGFYVPNKQVEKWFNSVKPFLFKDIEGLAPRGVLLDGVGGTGKTEFAKFVSREMEVPLFHLDIGGSLSRWQGESEANIRKHLATAAANAPCVLLLDEVEKALHTSNNEESSTRILAHLLWWLAEHKEKILTVMTTNNKAALPPELYRPGRIDAVFTLQPIDDPDVQYLIVDTWMEQWAAKVGVTGDRLAELCQVAVDALNDEPKTPAEVINHCKDIARTFYVNNLAPSKT